MCDAGPRLRRGARAARIRARFVRGVQYPCAGMCRQPRRQSGRHKAASPMIRAERYLNVPLAMVARERDKIRRAIELREEPSALLFEVDAVDRRPYDVVDGAAVIEIGGVLIHQEDWLSFWLGETGYDRIRAAFDMA